MAGIMTGVIAATMIAYSYVNGIIAYGSVDGRLLSQTKTSVHHPEVATIVPSGSSITVTYAGTGAYDFNIPDIANQKIWEKPIVLVTPTGFVGGSYAPIAGEVRINERVLDGIHFQADFINTVGAAPVDTQFYFLILDRSPG